MNDKKNNVEREERQLTALHNRRGYNKGEGEEHKYQLLKVIP